MWPAIWVSQSEQLVMLFAKWRGSMAEPWAYSVSHGQFLLRLHRESPRSLFVWCKNCQRVSFASHWREAAVQLSVGSSGHVTLLDGQHLSVSCGAVFAAETEAFDVQLPAGA
jgi:hypothetical protein